MGGKLGTDQNGCMRAAVLCGRGWGGLSLLRSPTEHFQLVEELFLIRTVAGG